MKDFLQTDSTTFDKCHPLIHRLNRMCNVGPTSHQAVLKWTTPPKRFVSLLLHSAIDALLLALTSYDKLCRTRVACSAEICLILFTKNSHT